MECTVGVGVRCGPELRGGGGNTSPSGKGRSRRSGATLDVALRQGKGKRIIGKKKTDADDLGMALVPDRRSSNIHPILGLMDILTITHLSIEDIQLHPYQGRSLALQGIIPFLNSISSLRIKKRVGIEATAILRRLAQFDAESTSTSNASYTIKWPYLRTITLDNVRYTRSEEGLVPSVRKVAQILRAIREVAPGFQRLVLEGWDTEDDCIGDWGVLVPYIEMR